MRIRQALKVMKKISKLKYARGTVRAAQRVCRQRKHRAAYRVGIRPGVMVTVQTDTVYDEEGVPVSVAPGTLGYVTELDGFPQILCRTVVGLCVVGVPPEHLFVKLLKRPLWAFR